jgi:hypothetical protein|tara:strand:- start:1113 stop:1355 length:243 start_codon:yes stop_codon:yes gene_type:complete
MALGASQKAIGKPSWPRSTRHFPFCKSLLFCAQIIQGKPNFLQMRGVTIYRMASLGAKPKSLREPAGTQYLSSKISGHYT